MGKRARKGEKKTAPVKKQPFYKKKPIITLLIDGTPICRQESHD